MADELPPGPPLHPVVQAALMARHWPRYVAACRRRYGSPFTLRVATMGTLVYLDDPADIKAVFAGDPAVFHAGEANAMLRGLLGDTSVLVIDDDVHRDRRRLMLAPFQREAVARQAGVIAEIAAADVARWPVGQAFPAVPAMSRITLEVILRTVIGASDPARLDALREVLPRLLNMTTVEMLSIATPSLQRRRPWRRVKRAIAEADALLYAEITERRRDPALADRVDVLSMLVRADENPMTDRELRDQLMTLLVAGHDTTATGLAWALERLTRHPRALADAEAAAERSAAGDPTGDDHLDAVCRETLRVRPVVYDVGRILTAPVELAGHRLPAGVMVVPAIGLAHSDARRYPEPERFDPQRMTGAAPGPTAWLPFGGGNRRCLGATFALVEMRLVLREVLTRVELATTTAADERQRLKHVILVPHRGGRVRVKRQRVVDGSPAPGRNSSAAPSPAS